MIYFVLIGAFITLSIVMFIDERKELRVWTCRYCGQANDNPDGLCLECKNQN